MPPASFNLKQRLAAFSLAQSSPSSSRSSSFTHASNGDDTNSFSRSPSNPTLKRKIFNPPIWMKRGQESPSNANMNVDVAHHYTEEDRRVVQDVLTKMIFQAGVDFETRPMVVLNASALPDPQVVSYDLLLSRILSYLDLYVEADYTVIFFAASPKNSPSWNWVWKAYRSLSRKYRKNLKQLYIVHSSFFSKMLFSLAGAIISPKFFRKLTYISTLSELAQHVPLTQIDIPPTVYQENLKFERRITMPIPTRSNIFGVPLEDIMGYDGEKGGVPRVVRDAIQFLRGTGMQDEGLFRRSPSSALLRAAQEAYDRGNVVSLETFADPYLAAVLLKKYLRDLPEPIFPEKMYAAIKRCPVPSNNNLELGDDDHEMASVRYVRGVILPELVPCAYILLSHVLHLLHDVSLRNSYNRMDATNLTIVICPNLVKSTNPMRDVMMCTVPVPDMSAPSAGETTSTRGLSNRLSQSQSVEGKTTLGMVIALCIRRYYEIFDEVVDRSEAIAPWRALGTSNSGLDAESSGAGNATYVLGDGEEEDDLDDEMLVMPLDQNASEVSSGGIPPASWGSSPPLPVRNNASQFGTNKRHKSNLSNGSNALSMGSASRSMHNDASSNSTPSAWTGTLRSSSGHPISGGRARSLISVSSSSDVPSGGTVRKGTITVGRGTTRKGSGAAVEAVSVVAAGFFTPPVSPPPPPIGKGSTPTQSKTGDGEEEERVLTVGERRRLFEGGA